MLDDVRGIVQNGNGNEESRVMTIDLPKLEHEPCEKLLLININKLDTPANPQAILDQVRFSWRVSKAKADQADYVLAVVRGVVVGAFVVEEWLPATRSNFPDHDRAHDDASKRWAFRGTIAPPDVWERFAGNNGKRIANDKMKHTRNPIKYWNIS